MQARYLGFSVSYKRAFAVSQNAPYVNYTGANVRLLGYVAKATRTTDIRPTLRTLFRWG